MIKAGTPLHFVTLANEVKPIVVGEFTIEITERGFYEPLVEIYVDGESRKWQLADLLALMGTGHVYKEPQAGKLMEGHRAALKRLRELTSLPIMQCRIALEAAGWNVDDALKALFAEWRKDSRWQI